MITYCVTECGLHDMCVICNENLLEIEKNELGSICYVKYIENMKENKKRRRKIGTQSSHHHKFFKLMGDFKSIFTRNIEK